jgi:hypothetical protein
MRVTVLDLEREDANIHDTNAVAIMKTAWLRELSRIFWYFIEHGGSIACEVSGHRKFGRGLEVPCKYTFTGKKRN